MNAEQFYTLIDKEDIPSLTQEEEAQLKIEIANYPYFQAPIFVYLKSLYRSDNDNFSKELSRLSIFVNDRTALFYHILSEEFAAFFKKTGKQEIAEDRTNTLLNAFFETQDSNDEDLNLAYNISNSSLASNDYFSYLGQVEKENDNNKTDNDTPLKHQSIIDSFIKKSNEDGGIRIEINKEENTSQPILQQANSNEDELDDDMFFTETLAKIYTKQKKYEKAYKIIKHLSLNYPKKNIYFADQLSFLEKLIINSKYKK